MLESEIAFLVPLVGWSAVAASCMQMHVGSHETGRDFGGLPAIWCRASALASALAVTATRKPRNTRVVDTIRMVGRQSAAWKFVLEL